MVKKVTSLLRPSIRKSGIKGSAVSAKKPGVRVVMSAPKRGTIDISKIVKAVRMASSDEFASRERVSSDLNKVNG